MWREKKEGASCCTNTFQFLFVVKTLTTWWKSIFQFLKGKLPVAFSEELSSLLFIFPFLSIIFERGLGVAFYLSQHCNTGAIKCKVFPMTVLLC